MRLVVNENERALTIVFQNLRGSRKQGKCKLEKSPSLRDKILRLEVVGAVYDRAILHLEWKKNARGLGPRLDWSQAEVIGLD